MAVYKTNMNSFKSKGILLYISFTLFKIGEFK